MYDEPKQGRFSLFKRAVSELPGFRHFHESRTGRFASACNRKRRRDESRQHEAGGKQFGNQTTSHETV
jgi:hypothetical protein